MKDWIGNRKSMFVTLGASNHTEGTRESNDYYATRSSDVLRFLEAYRDVPHKVWEPACGSGNISVVLEQLGHEVVSTDLVDRGYGTGGVDFLQQTQIPDGCECIMTNPPYRYATEFVVHGLRLLPDNGQLIMLVKTTFLEGQKRYNQIFRSTPPTMVFQYVSRALCAINGDFDNCGSSAASYCWMVWVKGVCRLPTIHWIL